MRNILSYVDGSVFTGKEIKTWCNYHIENGTSHKKVAQKVLQQDNFEDDIEYMLFHNKKLNKPFYFKRINSY